MVPWPHTLRPLRLCGEYTIFMEQQNRNLTAQVETFRSGREISQMPFREASPGKPPHQTSILDF